MEVPAVYVQGVFLELLRAALAPATVVSDMTPDTMRKLGREPVVLIEVWSTQALDPRFSTSRASVQIDAFLPKGQSRTAFELLSSALSALQRAWHLNTETASGTLSRLFDVTGPHQFPSSSGLQDAAADEVTRWTVSLTAVVTARVQSP